RQPVALGLGALVAPDERGAEDVARSIEHDATMHLAGEADGLDLAAGEFALGHGSGDGLAGSAPPVVWVLLGPADVLGVDGCVFAAGGGDDFAAAIDQDCPGAACSDVDSKKHVG